MKKIICVLICSVMVLTASPNIAYADSMEEGDCLTVSLASAPNISRSLSLFAEGETQEIDYTFEFDTGLTTIVKEVTISYECVSIPIPYTNKSVEAYKILSDFDDETKALINMFVSQDYPEAELLSSSSHYYNCHSYAWYSNNTSTNNYWINDPKNFYLDNANYTEVSTPAVGDIICYFNGTENLHSGIVSAVNNVSPNGVCEDSNTVEVISKWDYRGVYAHNGAYCPYVGSATSVKYYRYHSHEFTYLRNIMNPSIHTATCSICDYTFTENHTYQSLPDGSSSCTKCGYTSSGQIIMSDNPEYFGE